MEGWCKSQVAVDAHMLPCYVSLEMIGVRSGNGLLLCPDIVGGTGVKGYREPFVDFDYHSNDQCRPAVGKSEF